MPSGVMHTLWNGTGVEDDDTTPEPPGTLFASGSLFWVTQTNGSVYHRSNSTQTYLTNFDVFGAPFEVRPKDWLQKDMVAWECALWMCVQAFEVTVSSSSQTQIPIQNFSTIANNTHDIFTDASFDKINTFENLTFDPLPPSMNPAPQSQYQFSIESALTMSSYLTSTIKGNAGADLRVVSFSSDATQAIANATTGSLDAWIKNLATSMTNVLRSSTSQAGAYDVPIEATRLTDAIYSGAGYQLAVQIRWPWIVLPALLVLLSLVVLVTTIIRTSWRSIWAWRGSPLVFMFMEVDAEIRRHAVGQMEVFGGLQDRVGKDEVLLEKDRDGGRYLRSASDP
ncbi:MAG: hypothetical protein OHK93_007375 [Ramalina farinacea]|uniref:Uncharacterized protein n=1 Tax=Ramalina farinacea TaxID=258253 RepID=A0AA43TQX0_9LECA|nr:hypothetical protein [Ramalina farinacea]